MAAPKGHKRYGGRVKGTPNKSTMPLLDKLRAKNFEPVDELLKVFPGLTPSEKAKICLSLLDFIYPKKKAVEVSEPGGDALGAKASDTLEKIFNGSASALSERKAKARANG